MLKIKNCYCLLRDYIPYQTKMEIRLLKSAIDLLNIKHLLVIRNKHSKNNWMLNT